MLHKDRFALGTMLLAITHIVLFIRNCHAKQRIKGDIRYCSLYNLLKIMLWIP